MQKPFGVRVIGQRLARRIKSELEADQLDHDERYQHNVALMKQGVNSGRIDKTAAHNVMQWQQQKAKARMRR